LLRQLQSSSVVVESMPQLEEWSRNAGSWNKMRESVFQICEQASEAKRNQCQRDGADKSCLRLVQNHKACKGLLEARLKTFDLLRGDRKDHENAAN
jgi:hypothetical protein